MLLEKAIENNNCTGSVPALELTICLLCPDSMRRICVDAFSPTNAHPREVQDAATRFELTFASFCVWVEVSSHNRLQGVLFY